MAKIGILVMTHKVQERGTRKESFYDSFEWLGMQAIQKEIDRKKNQVKYISVSQIDDYDFVLVSVTSLYDVFNLINEMPKKRKAEVIIGGQGVVNVKSYTPYFDKAVFGRAEGQINDILDGEKPSNILDINEDPDVEGRYEYRQPQYLIDGENNVGCPYKCRFCQYSWTHKCLRKTGNFQSAIGDFKHLQEDDLRHLKVEDGRYYVSAIDGVSEESRFKVNKKIYNEDIIKKIKEIYSKEFTKRVSLKLFVICGYPWERYNGDYLNELKEVFRKADEPKSKFKIQMHLLFTPFSPEPLTPMETERPILNVDWRKELTKNYKLYFSDTLEVYIMRYINTPYRLFERIFMNRASIEDGWLLENVLKNKKFRKMKSWKKMLWLENNIDMEKFINPKKKEWSYLRVPKEKTRETVEHG